MGTSRVLCVGGQNKARATLAHYLNRCWHIAGNSGGGRLGLGGGGAFPIRKEVVFFSPHPRAAPALSRALCCAWALGDGATSLLRCVGI